MSRYLEACVLFVALMVPAAARADVDVAVSELSSYDMPEGFDLQSAQIQAASQGRTMLSATTGQESAQACTVVVATRLAATSYAYRYADGPTRCVGVQPHPDGGFFVRGERADRAEGAVSGFTARLDAAGAEMWTVDDRELVGGTAGEFLGEYVGPHPALAYNAESDKLLGFTTGKLNIGPSGQALTQAHVIGADGTLQESGKTFGDSGSAGVIGGAITRRSAHDFLVYIFSAGSQGASFFTYDGRISIGAFKPGGRDWSNRYVHQMVDGADGNVYLLWTDEDGPAAPTHVSAVDADAEQAWSASWEARLVDPDDADPVDLGPPRAILAGDQYILVVYYVGDQFMVRVADEATGESLGVVSLSELTDTIPVALVGGKNSAIRVLATDQDAPRAHEFRLDITNMDGKTGVDAGGDAAGIGDAGSAISGGNDASGCASVAADDPSGRGLGGVLAFLLAAFTMASRRTRRRS